MHLTLKPTVFEEKCDTLFGDVFSIYLEESVWTKKHLLNHFLYDGNLKYLLGLPLGERKLMETE